MSHLKPPQEVLDARFGDRATFVPNPRAIALLEQLEQRWEARRRHLRQVEQLSEEEIDERYSDFHDAFLREQFPRQ